MLYSDVILKLNTLNGSILDFASLGRKNVSGLLSLYTVDFPVLKNPLKILDHDLDDILVLVGIYLN